ncbi:Nif3-like dinuclear metal center hexameric protein [Gordonia sp. ABSL1-1]|uniref:Nif3-like dinuclear metal center hexameric protein n=1 Tax=Gordonia sp. ABSL1-1 TaxID=3053923 RepID=UPI0025733A8D|nr:Nif3-like dinuclear metal center hexameric protein [Gordonia sp. ABSL1-1]MDL9937327.1 Nif3-like dinuclear metal center hexameric protein [Gordonia sp. ABSL1-1]
MGESAGQSAVGSVTVGDVVGVVEAAYPPALAASWDEVGLVCGDRAEQVRTVRVCVDVTDEVVDAAVADGIDLILAHHPLLLRGVTTVAADTGKGRIIHRLIRNGIALLTAHTNADSARPGVSDALADLLGLVDTVPIDPVPVTPMDKWVVMVPEGNVEQVSEAMFAAGAGTIGEYRDCSWSVVGTGQFEPLENAAPTIGEIGMRTHVDEARVEMVASRGIRRRVLAALRAAHPYEEPAFDVLELADLDSVVGIGRAGTLAEPVTLAEFTRRAASLLGTPAGVRAAGDPDRLLRTVAVCGGSGDSYLDTVGRLGVDAYLTADLRHHPADEALRIGGPALIDAGHWATEFPWCAHAAALLADQLGVVATVHDQPTDPFRIHSTG